MSKKEYNYPIRFTVEDLAKFPTSPLSKECAQVLWEKERDNLTVSELFVLDAIDERPELSELLFNLFYTMVKNLYNEKKSNSENPRLENIEEESRKPFDINFNFSVPYRNSALSCRSEFKFSAGWEYVTVDVTVGKANKKIVNIDDYCIDFFESFGKDMKQGDSFEGVLDNLKRHVKQILK